MVINHLYVVHQQQGFAVGFSNRTHEASLVIMYETDLGLAVARGYVVFSRVRR